MNMILRFIIFLVIFLGIYGGIHFYIYYRFNSFFKFSSLKWIILALAVSTPLAMIISRSFHNTITNIVYAITSAWMGIAFFLLSSLVLYEILKFFIKLKPETWGIILLAVVAIISIFSLVFGQFIFVKELTIPIENLDSQKRIVHISDLHLGTIHNSNFMNRVVQKINTQKPDMVFITGDVFDSISLEKKPVKEFNLIDARSFFVTGNHENYGTIKITKKTIKEANITFLRDQVTTYKGIQIIGMDHPRDDRFTGPNLSKININKSKPSILLFHQPKGMINSENKGIDLQLSGHTHAGQIFPFNLIVKLFYPKFNGLYKIKNMYLHVSPGTGTWGPPMRFGSKNEIAVINLVPK